jgi:SAM-dependent methyltransferase
MSNEEIWASSLSEELDFWARWFDTKGLDWPEDYLQRLNPDALLPDYLVSLLTPGNTVVRILDVGSGPISKLGSKVPGRQIQLAAVDPLAKEYNEFLDARGITPRVRTRRGEGEQLLSIFAPNSFDIVHAQNSVDHSRDPLRVVQQMLAVVKPGGHVRLEHATNEGERQSYQGLHQWNLDGRDGHFFIWNREKSIDVTESLREIASTTCCADEACCSVTVRKPWN